MFKKNQIRKSVACVAMATILTVAGATPAFTRAAGVPPPAGPTTTFSQYSAKFLCGVPTAAEVASGMIEAGEYSTSVNLHNPNMFSTQPPLTFSKKAVLALPEGTALVPPSAFKSDTLPNDFSEALTCTTIRGLLGAAAPPAPAFIEGFVVVIVPPGPTSNELDVDAVYTSSRPGMPALTLEVQHIPVRLITP